MGVEWDHMGGVVVGKGMRNAAGRWLTRQSEGSRLCETASARADARETRLMYVFRNTHRTKRWRLSIY